MGTFHKNLSQERWNSLDIIHQILNISSELNRARNRLPERFSDKQLSLERALELIDFSIEDRSKWNKGRLRELLRFRDLVAENYVLKKSSEDELKILLKVFLRMHGRTASVEL